MGTVAEKLTYLNGTKSSLKTAINNLGGNIDNNTTFRAYSNELDTIYDNLPKVSDTGTNVSLSPTLKGRLGIVPKGNTYQESTTGKQLFNAIEIPSSSGIVVEDGGKTIKPPISSSGNGYISTGKKLSELCPTIKIGDEVWLNFSRNLTDANKMIYLNGADDLWSTGGKRTITQEMLDSIVALYGNRANSGETGQCILTDFRMTKLSTDNWEKFTYGASPNPDYPQKIQSATGTQKVVVSGKNLLDTSGLTEKTQNGVTITPVYESGLLKYININGTFDGSSNYSYKVATLNVTNGTTYYMSGVTGWNYNTLQLFANSSQAFPSGNRLQSYNGETSREALVDETISIGLYVYAGQTYNNVKVYPMVSLSSSSYQPYQEPQEVDIELSSRNLFDKNNTTDGYYMSNSTGELQTNASFCVSNKINVKPNTQYYINSNINRHLCYFDKENNFISGLPTTSIFTKGLITTPSNASYMYYSPSIEDKNTLQIVEGTEAPETYIPYYNYTPNKIGDYEDYIGGTPDNWVLYKNIGKVVLDGSESWYKWGTDTFYITRLSNVRTGLSDYYKYNSNATGASQLNNGEFFIHDSTNNNVVIFRNTSITSVADFKTWLSTHNTELLYVLAETQQTPITDTNLISQLNELYYLQSYNDTTNIDVTGNLPMRITASAIKGA